MLLCLQEEESDQEGGDWSDVSASQGRPVTGSNTADLEKCGTGLSSGPSERAWSCLHPDFKHVTSGIQL